MRIQDLLSYYSCITYGSVKYIILYITSLLLFILGFPGGLMIKNSPANAGDKKHRLDPWVGKIPWRRKWQPTPVFLPGKSHGQRSLVDYSLWGQKNSQT